MTFFEEAETSAVEALLYACGFAHSLTQIEKLRSSYFTSAFNLNGCNLRTVNQKNSFYSYSLENSPYCNCLMDSSMSLCYHNPFVGLNTFFVPLTYSDTNTYSVSNVNIREIFVLLCIFKSLYYFCRRELFD